MVTHMTEPDYRGARGANAGYDFQVLWVLRQALALLDQDSNLMAITVEGVQIEDEGGTSQSTWDGVDCALYYGGEQAATANLIVINQLKYSAANPNQAWTIARLKSASNKKHDNSILRKLAKAFKALRDKRPDLAGSGDLQIRLVSNQRVDQDVLDAFKNQSEREALQDVSGLSHDDFEAFMVSIDFSECGQGSRFALEERLFAVISEWVDDDPRVVINDLLRQVRHLMLPESKGEYITRHSVLSWMGVADLGALFPCPSEITLVHHLTSRAISKTIVEQIILGNQRICLHGEGGCGKTTTLQEIEMLLPQGSVVIKYDCYGGGHYLDSDAYRHRPQDAFLHLVNDLARQLRIPLLINRGAEIDFPRTFKKRLERASEVVHTRGEDVLLVIVIDAADNSVTAANSRSPREHSFVHDFSAIGNLPANVRFIITARSGKVMSLNLPRSFKRILIPGFSLEETARHVGGYWNDLPDAWIEDFHDLSGGNPRVQKYALEYALRLDDDEPFHALEYLRPAGKGLDQIFREQLKHAQYKVGSEKEIDIFCCAIATMPRPIPVADLSAVTNLEADHIRDICSDLSPGVRYLKGSVSLADEDFENFLRVETENQLGPIQEAIASHFLQEHRLSAYAASHVAVALLVANRGQELIELIKSEGEPSAIKDPIIRREVYLQRLQIGMKVCRESGNNVGALMTLLIGAEALKTSFVIRRILVENPDLSANFAQESARRIILRDPGEIENHGPLLLHLMTVDSRNGDSTSVREDHRQVRAWLQSRSHFFEERRSKHPDSTPLGWDIDYQAIAAETEALLRTAGPKGAIANLRRWRPKHIALEVALTLCSRLIIAGEAAYLEQALSEESISKPWDLFVLVHLGLAGMEVDLVRLERCLAMLLRRGLIRLDALKHYSNREFNEKYLDVLLTACELFIARGGNPIRVKLVLECFTDEKYRNLETLSTFQTSQIDLTLRAYALVERLADRALTLDSYLVAVLATPDPLSTESKRRVETRQKADELRRFIAPLIGIYDTRAQLLIGDITANDFMSNIDKAIKQYKNKQALERNWSASEEYMRARVTLSLSHLMIVTDINIPMLFESANSLMSGVPDTAHRRDVVLVQFALVSSMHQRVVAIAAERASAVRNARISAEEKIAELVSLARLLLPISLNDAGSLFSEAVEISSEIDADVEQEIAVFAPLLDRAVSSVNVNSRREIARNLAVVVCDASLRLGGLNETTWSKAGHTLATADLPFALAATGRWEDLNIAKRNFLLPSILDAALVNHSMTSIQVSALFPLLDQVDEDLFLQIVDYAIDQEEHIESKVIAEYLAREEVLRFGKSPRQTVSIRLDLLNPRNSSGPWQQLLGRTTKFYQDTSSKLANHVNDLGNSSHKSKGEIARPDPLADIDWTGYRFISSEEISTFINRLLSAREAASAYISTSQIFGAMESIVRIGDRASHLTALASLNVGQYIEPELTDAIARRIEKWYSTPSVRQWCREQLLGVITKLLPGFSRYLSIARSPLPALLGKSGASDNDIRNALLAGIGHHVDKLTAPAIYALVGLIAQYCAPSDIAQVAEQYAKRLVGRISPEDRETWDLDDVPDNPIDGVARLVYALMGDIDLRIRWRASYVVRNLAHLGELPILFRLIELYERKQEQSFRDPNSPFYWLASKLWLMIALDRIATQVPEVLKGHGPWFFERATDNDFPHALLRSFAKSAVAKLVEGGYLEIDDTQRELLDSANTSRSRQERIWHSYQGGVEKFNTQKGGSRRFQFNRMDTLPYWYEAALRVFSDVKGEEFLDVAERWIVERWELSSSPWNWEEEPRKHRLNDDPYLPIDHRHGSLPTLERYSTHLEWHAMWCAVGQLLQTRSLTTLDDNSYRSYENWLENAGLTIPPLWLSDLLTVKPHKEHLWFPPEDDIEVWLDNASDSELLTELGMDEEDESITASSYYSVYSRNFTLTGRVVTSLVAPETARSLVRALQTIEDSMDYRLPQAEDGFEIDVAPYRLFGWLSDTELYPGLEERDPLRYEVRRIECEPSLKTKELLNLIFAYDGQVKWIEAESGAPVFSYKTWGDNRGDEREESFRYDPSVRSEGWSLRIDKRALKAFLKKMGLDLIVEIGITRKNKGYAYYSRYEEERAKETRYERVLLLRQDGSIEAIEGRIGTWAAPGS